MNRIAKYIVAILCCILSAPGIAALDVSREESPDSVVPEKRKNLVERVIAYFDDSNKARSDKRFDVSFIGGPHYSSDTKFGIGLVAAGIYSTAPGDTLTPESNVALYSDVSTVGFYMIGLRGTNVFSHDRMRLAYDINLYSFSTKFWGIGYEMARNNDNETKYNDFHTSADVNLLFNLGRSVYMGPGVYVNYTHAGKVKRPELWEGERLSVVSPGAGLMAEYDTRDNLTAPTRGWFVTFKQLFYPRFIGNHYPFASTEATASVYFKAWRGAVIASKLHSRWAYGDVPWPMLSTMGGSGSMRGYYEGRYRDKFEADLTVELRQHVWRRNGVVLWLGVGTVAPSPCKVTFSHLLPNVGIGYRWEFKRNTNVRLDFGIGRGETGFIFNINEAF